MVFFVSVFLIPFLAVLIDGVAGIRARDGIMRPDRVITDDFRILVPIWGSACYLTNIQHISQYGPRVTLCTTGDEQTEFYSDLARIASCHGFQIYRDQPRTGEGRGVVHKERDTAGTTRDRLVRNALARVREPYVVPLDADSQPGGDLALLVGELARRRFDLASVRLVPGNPYESLLTRCQQLEYQLSMQIRIIAPWMVSGACHVARTPVLREVMMHHSLFFQGNDVETGLLAEELGYRVGHIPFPIFTDVPARLRPWVRQRLAWAGGQFRLFIINFRFIRRHPFFWFYGSLLAFAGAAFRWQAFERPGYQLITAGAAYTVLVLYLYIRGEGPRWQVLLMPAYLFVTSLVLAPLGAVCYARMVLADGNWGIIRHKRVLLGIPGKSAAARRPGHVPDHRRRR